jgi:hypothetical protein
VDAAAAKKVTDDAAAMKKAVEEATVAKKATDDAAVVKKAADDVAVVKKVMNDTAAMKKTADNAVTTGSGSSLARRWEPREWLRLAALHLRPSGDFSAPRSLSTLCKPSFIISCTASMILIWFYWHIVCHPPAGCPLWGVLHCGCTRS